MNCSTRIKSTIVEMLKFVAESFGDNILTQIMIVTICHNHT